MKPGVYAMPESQYHADPCVEPSLSASISKPLIYRSPRHAWMQHPRLNPDYQHDHDSKFDLGTVAHSVLLKDRECVEVIVADDWRTKAAKEARDAARAAGKVPLLEKHFEDVLAMVGVAHEAIANCPDLSDITLADGKAEQTLIWQEKNGIWCRSRLDWMGTDRKLILDYKTTAASAEPNDWIRTMLNVGYDVQASFYLRGNRATEGPADTKFVFLVQEVEPPYACSFVGMPLAFLELGNSKVAQAIDMWRQCTTTNRWPAYSSRICWAEPPGWAETKWMERSVSGELERGFPYDPKQLFGDLKNGLHA